MLGSRRVALPHERRLFGWARFPSPLVGNNYELRSFIAASDVRGSADAIAALQRNNVHAYQRPDDGVAYDPTRTSLRGDAERISISKFGGGITRFQAVYQRFSPGFETNDIGYQPFTVHRSPSTDIVNARYRSGNPTAASELSHMHGYQYAKALRRPSLSRFQFAISSGPESVRQAGVVESDSFSEAVVLLSEKIPVRTGDSLEIGVNGFPPARFQCVSAMKGGRPIWVPEGKMAA